MYLLDDECAHGFQAAQIAVIGFTFGLLVLIVGLHHLEAKVVVSILSLTLGYLGCASEVTISSYSEDWTPLLSGVIAAGALAAGGSRLLERKPLVSGMLSSGLFPTVSMSLIAGHLLAAFGLFAPGQRTLDDYIPLIAATAVMGLIANSAYRLSAGQAGVPSCLAKEPGLSVSLMSLASFVAYNLSVALDGKQSQWHKWMGLVMSGAGAGFLAQAGNLFAETGRFISPKFAVTSAPVSLLALLGAYLIVSLRETMVAGYSQRYEDWIPLGAAAPMAALLACGGSRVQSGKPFFAAIFTQGNFPKGFLVVLCFYVMVSFYSSVEQRERAGGVGIFGALLTAVVTCGLGSRVGKRISQDPDCSFEEAQRRARADGSRQTQGD